MSDKVDLAVQNQIKNLEAATGKSLTEWIAIARKLGSKHGEMVKCAVIPGTNKPEKPHQTT